MGKILLLSFGDDEDEMINSVLSALEVGRRTYKIEKTKILRQRYCKVLVISKIKSCKIPR